MIVRVVSLSKSCFNKLPLIAKERRSVKEKLLMASLGITILVKRDVEVCVLEYSIKRIPSSQLNFFLSRNIEGYYNELSFIYDELRKYSLFNDIDYKIEVE